MLDIAGIASSPFTCDPFEYVIARDVVSSDCAEAILKDCPVLRTTGSFPVGSLRFGPTFEALLADVRSRSFADAIGVHFELRDLAALPQLITFRGWSSAKDGSVHTDAEWKLISVLLYLNASWNQPGGRLRLLRSRSLDDVAVEIPPTCGTLVAFRRSSRSFHGHKPCAGERRVLQINWVTDGSYVAREERRHRRSARLKSLLGFGRH